MRQFYSISQVPTFYYEVYYHGQDAKLRKPLKSSFADRLKLKNAYHVSKSICKLNKLSQYTDTSSCLNAGAFVHLNGPLGCRLASICSN